MGYTLYIANKLGGTLEENKRMKTEITDDVNNNGLIDRYIEIEGKKYFSVIDGKNLEGIVDKNRLEKD
ncbi:hypothetical protein HYX16_03460 [Candidatus Woesearchaeota archaeon]|nr:hypothetical protein [Candidatus Woesearchaeota archaeon]